MSMTLISLAFAAGGTIPSLYTCDGRDTSPQLQWSGIPPATKSLVLIVDDPDAPDPAAPQMTWVHWVLYNLPPESNGLPPAVAPGKEGKFAADSLQKQQQGLLTGPAAEIAGPPSAGSGERGILLQHNVPCRPPSVPQLIEGPVGLGAQYPHLRA